MRWQVKPEPNPEQVKILCKDLGVSLPIGKLLAQRGITTFKEAKRFFRPKLNHLHDPFLMQDMKVAVLRVLNALANNESILVYGDYDVDGTTAVSLVYSFLKTQTDRLAYYIPDRYSEGYGVSYKGIDFAKAEGYSLIITLDCGIKAVEKVEYATSLGIDFIICDHHRPGLTLPKAIAVLDPKREDCKYPYTELCGCGVGFKLIQAIAKQQGLPEETLWPYLDLVATAIAADIVPITGENRVLTYFGLKQLNTSPRAGLKVLIEQLKKEELSVTDLVFVIAPRINAAGRMLHGKEAVKLLTTTNEEEIKKQAEAIEQLNRNRKDEDARITEEALQQIAENKEENNYTTVVFSENWHKGVIGIVASRLIETYYRPTVVFTKNGDTYAASARSVKGFDVYKALEACSEFIEQFGGHKYAAGLTLKAVHYSAFKAAFEMQVKLTIPDDLRTAQLSLDTRLDFKEITPKFYRILKQFAPFGPGNMTPVFYSEQVYDSGYSKTVGDDNMHLRLVVNQPNQPTFTGIGFNLGHKLPLVKTNSSFSLAYSVDENTWEGVTNLQLKIKGIKKD